MSQHKVKILPLNETVEVDSSKNLLEALKEVGVYLKSSCGGVASCSDCTIKICDGMDNISAPTFGEKTLLGNVFHITKERLSCQFKVMGSVTIDVTGHLDHHDLISSQVKK